MTRDDAQAWLDAYVAAWRSNDPQFIAALFTEDVEYRYHPWGEPVVGREAVVASWLQDPDDPDSWDAVYQPFVLESRRMVATGTSRYFARAGEPERIYHNCFLVEFDQSGRCRSFVEFYVQQP
jgi:hypothetical protein